MPSFYNSYYRLGAKRMTTKPIGTNTMMAAALLAITVVGRASVDEVVRRNQVANESRQRLSMLFLEVGKLDFEPFVGQQLNLSPF
jgi:hypothetical protein